MVITFLRGGWVERVGGPTGDLNAIRTHIYEWNHGDSGDVAVDDYDRVPDIQKTAVSLDESLCDVSFRCGLFPVVDIREQYYNGSASR